jgi:rhodanese-related sulfurtransferase
MHTQPDQEHAMATKNPGEPFSRITVAEAKAKLDAGTAVMVDVRNPNEYAEVHAPGVLLVPVNDILAQVAKVRDFAGDKEVLFICRSGQRSALAAEYVTAAGMTNVSLANVEGGMLAWVGSGYPTGD